MFRTFVNAPVVFALCALTLPTLKSQAEDDPAPTLAEDSAAVYELKYKFKPGESMRTNVTHQATVKTTIDGSSQTAQTVSISIKRWDVDEVSDAGVAKFTHSVEYVDMWNQLSGREKIEYDSRKGTEPPAGFEMVAKTVAVPLTVFTMDERGKVLSRENKAPATIAEAAQLTIPLPERAVPIGHAWEFPYDVPVTLRSGETRVIKTRQRFKLEEVKNGVATIKVDTQVLTPVNNPEIEAQLVQRESNGTVKFDIDAGRVLSQQIDLDRRVVGYPNQASSMHYRTRFTEELLKGDVATAAKPKQAETK